MDSPRDAAASGRRAAVNQSWVGLAPLVEDRERVSATIMNGPSRLQPTDLSMAIGFSPSAATFSAG